MSQTDVRIGFSTQADMINGTEYSFGRTCFSAGYIFQSSLQCSAVILKRGVWRIKAGVFSPPLVTSIVLSNSLYTPQPPSNNREHHDLLQSILCSLFRRFRSRCSDTWESTSECRCRYVLLETTSIRHKLNQTNIGTDNLAGVAANVLVDDLNVNALSNGNTNNNN